MLQRAQAARSLVSWLANPKKLARALAFRNAVVVRLYYVTMDNLGGVRQLSFVLTKTQVSSKVLRLLGGASAFAARHLMSPLTLGIVLSCVCLSPDEKCLNHDYGRPRIARHTNAGVSWRRAGQFSLPASDSFQRGVEVV